MSEQSRSLRLDQLDPNMKIDDIAADAVKWLSPKEAPFHIAGFPWLAQENRYRRLPVAPPLPLPEAVDKLADCTAGGQIRFRTNTRKLSIRVRLQGAANMYHMPATGQCGFDCYIEHEGVMRYHSTTRWDHRQREYEHVLFDYPQSDRTERNVTVYFPLYQGVEAVELGFEPDAVVAAPPAYALQGRALFYGTSITQGGCATRPGMAYTNILSRRFPLEFVNLGFSGSGLGEPEVASAIAAIPGPACLVLDYEANCPVPEQMRKTLPEFINIYRRAHPHVPILVLSKIRFGRERFDEKLLQLRLEMKRIQEDAVAERKRQGDARVYFGDGSGLLGADDYEECTVDGVHPTDLGFLRMADGIAPMLAQLLDVQA